ncbi:MAG: MFS transporter [Aquincola sp.]|nr:MFS transporter [Aquincola sp.]MDH4287822.1 MFS transporter [Aquincola sp.]MDH5328549.1 MFS transporter [Aquincola sp.]
MNASGETLPGVSEASVAPLPAVERASPRATHPWRWIPTLYFAQALPNVAVATLSVVMYKNLGLANTDIALYTSWLYLPWVVKPLWSPLVDLFGRKRGWTVALQFVVGVAFALVALSLPAPQFFRLTLAMFWLLAFASATHDIAADGLYMLALSEKRQAAFVGVRSTFFRLAMIAGQGALVVLAGLVYESNGSYVIAWQVVFSLLAALFLGAMLWHGFMLPRPASDRAAPRGGNPVAEFASVFAAFFRKREIATILAFLLLYRLAEAQLVKLAAPFLLDAREQGGLGLTTAQLGIVYGSAGVAALTVGGILGGLYIAGVGLKRALWPLLLAMHVPNLAYVALAAWQPYSLWLVGTAVVVEQFGYGFGFTAYMVYMLMVASQDGAHRTAHYALATGFMALGMMLPGMAAGWLQSLWGYTAFFVWVCIATLPSFVVAARLRIDPAFGRRDAAT